MKWTDEAQKWAEESRVAEAERAEAERLAAARGKNEVGLREAQAAVGKREMKAVGACAVCGGPVYGYPWWTKNPAVYADAEPVHGGECWSKVFVGEAEAWMAYENRISVMMRMALG